jgi:hypothetical protein
MNSSAGTISVNGTSVPISSLSSSSGQSAAGIPKSTSDGLSDAIAQVDKKVADKMQKIGATTATNGFADGGSGGGAGGPGAGAGDDAAAMAAMMGKGGKGSKSALNRDPAQVAGMQKMYHGEPIGVAGDGIFLMMSRRYKVKESQESFYNDSELSLKAPVQK